MKTLDAMQREHEAAQVRLPLLWPDTCTGQGCRLIDSCYCAVH